MAGTEAYCTGCCMVRVYIRSPINSRLLFHSHLRICALVHRRVTTYRDHIVQQAVQVARQSRAEAHRDPRASNTAK